VSRKSQLPPTGAEPIETSESTITPTVDGEPKKWAPSDGQRRAKSRLLIEMRHDPTLNPNQLSHEQLAPLLGVGATTLKEWHRESGEFRVWLMAKRETEERAQFLLDTTLDEIGRRLYRMSDKDFLNAAKLLADIVSKQQDAAQPAEIDFSHMSREAIIALVQRLDPTLIPAGAASAQPQLESQ